MKKRNTIFFTILNFIMGALCGLCYLPVIIQFIKSGKSDLYMIGAFIFFIIYLFVCYAVQVILHESGHLIFGIMSGYRFLSFRIASFIWVKEAQGIHLNRMKIAGTAGQCLLAPPDECAGKIPYILYLMGGCIMNSLSAFFCLLLIIVFSFPLFPSSLLAICAVIGFMMALMNGIPMQTSYVVNDGGNICCIQHDPQAMNAFWIQMKITECMKNKQRLKEMPDAWFEKPAKAALQNNLIATIAVFRCNRLLDMGAYEAAQTEIEALLQEDVGLLGLHQYLLTNDLIFCELIHTCRQEYIKQFQTKEFTKFCKQMHNSPALLRTQYAYFLLLQQDEAKALKIKTVFDKAVATYPYPSDLACEKEMMMHVDTLFAQKITTK